MIDFLIRKIELRDRLSDQEKNVLAEAMGPPREVGPNRDIIREGDRPTESTLILEGYTLRQQVLTEGDRQITAIHIPGDFVDLHSFLIKTMDHSITTLTPCTIAGVPHIRLREISEQHPHLSRLLWLLTLIDAAIHRRWLTAMGRQSALAHTAHLLCEMYVRQKEIRLTTDATFRMPLTQAKLADTLGLSAVHTNRVLRDLREGGFVEWQGDRVTVKDWEALKELAEFDPTYLSCQDEPR
jgi:CRP-like cAMP-binding protein